MAKPLLASQVALHRLDADVPSKNRFCSNSPLRFVTPVPAGFAIEFLVTSKGMAKKNRPSIDPRIKELLGFEPDRDDADVLKAYRAASTRVCKPCWELKYYPYGPIVEQFPLLTSLCADAMRHNENLRKALAQDHFPDGTQLDVDR
jgi:hypothetical protein